MSDRPIIFSAPMVRALLAGRKTQTRHLAASPLRKCEVGDRLWVRESLWVVGDGIRYAARDADDYCFDVVENHAFHPGRDLWMKRANADKAIGTPAIHMPRWASRLTLIVEGVRVEPLQAISEADAIAEGIEQISCRCSDGVTRDLWHGHPHVGSENPITAYSDLWNSLHNPRGYACTEDAPESWQANPQVVAITFRVVAGNIDQVPA